MATTAPMRRLALTLARSSARPTLTPNACVNATSRTVASPLRTSTVALAASVVARNDANPRELKLSAVDAQRGGGNSTRAVALAAAVSVALASALASADRDVLVDDGGAQCEGAVLNLHLRNPRDTRGHYALFNEIGRGGKKMYSIDSILLSHTYTLTGLLCEPDCASTCVHL